MRSRERLGRVSMQRVALVAPVEHMRALLVEVADAGTVALDPGGNPVTIDEPATAALHRAGAHTSDVEPVVVRDSPDIQDLEAHGEVAVLAGEAEIEHQAAAAIPHGRVAAALGWMPTAAIGELRARVAPIGGAVVDLRAPPGVEPPTLLAPQGAAKQFRVLVDTYGTVRYADIDPTIFAAIAFAVMFGMMFGDAGEGLVLIVAALLARRRWRALARFRSIWALVFAAGCSAMVFGFAYGEFFGPTHVVPTLWLEPLDDPLPLLGAALVVGAVLLAASGVIATVNRWREGGPRYALHDPSGIPVLCWYAGLGLLAVGVVAAVSIATLAGVVLLACGIGLVLVGRTHERGGVPQGVVESLDGPLRLGSNVVSFARLAAFGLMHAAIASVVWDATVALWGPSPSAVFAVVLFVLGNGVAFALEGLVVGVQALRLEYYELFSRIFVEEGRPYRPWHVRVVDTPIAARTRIKEAS